MSEELPLEGLASDELAELLEEFGTDLSPEQIQDALKFVKALGGIDAALAALQGLEAERRDAA